MHQLRRIQTAIQNSKDNFYIWSIISLAIVINVLLVLHFTLIYSHTTAAPLPILDTIQHGRYIAKRIFLMLVALGILIYWLKPFGVSANNFKKQLVPILIILVVGLSAHFLNFKLWFNYEDWRAFQESNQGLQFVENPYYAVMPYYVTMLFAGTNFAPYMGLGLFAYGLCGIAIYWLLNLIQSNKTISLLIALFFVTTPNYFQDMLNMAEFIGDGVSLLLFILSIYLLIKNFYAGAVIFAAAALELGVSRTNFIAIPLLITGLLFTLKDKTNVFFRNLAFLYFPVLFVIAKWTVDYTAYNAFNDPLKNYPFWQVILKFFTMTFAMTIPHEFIGIFIRLSQIFFRDSSYIAPLLGMVIFILLTLLVIIFYCKKNALAAKILFLGMVILAGSSIAPTLYGLERLMQDVSKLTLQFTDNFPNRYTIYGSFPSLGASLILAGVVLFLFSKKTKYVLYVVLFYLVFSNILSSQNASIMAEATYAKPQKEMNQQLKTLLPFNGKQKLVFVPDNHKNRFLFNGISRYLPIYAPSEPIVVTFDRNVFMVQLKKLALSSNQLYLLTHAQDSNKIYDFSNELRKVPKEKLADNLDYIINTAEEKSK